MTGDDNKRRKPTVIPSHRMMMSTRALQAFDLVFVMVLSLAPLIMGGRHPLGRLVYVLLVAGMAASWAVHLYGRDAGSYRHSGLELWGALALILVFMQSVPLPASWIHLLSPRVSHFLPSWSTDASVVGLSAWRYLSLTPDASRVGLIQLFAHLTFFSLICQRIDDRQQVERALNWLGLAVVWLAACGLLQYLFSNDKFLWLYQDPFRGTKDVVRGPFYNENHFAHLLALGLLPLGAWLRRRREAQRSVRRSFTARQLADHDLGTLLLAIAIPCVLLTLLLTRSRGGIVAGLVAYLISELAGARHRGRGRQVARIATVTAVMLLALSVHGVDDVRAELSSLTSTSFDEIDRGGGRRKLWQCAREIVGQFTLSGAGVGSFRDTFPLFFREPRYHDYSYAESGFLQVAAETGLVGCGLLCGAFFSLGRRLRPVMLGADEDSPTELAWPCLGGLVISMFHSLIDFVWFIPACFVPTLVMLACALRLAKLRTTNLAAGAPRTTEASSPCGGLAWRIGCLSAGLACSTLILLGPARAGGYWNAYLLLAKQDRSEDLYYDAIESGSTSRESLQAQAELLRQVVAFDPSHVRAQSHLASLCLQLFELDQSASANPMSLAQIRDAALASQFPTMVEQNGWLARVMEDRRRYLDEALVHCLQAIHRSPLQGRAYVSLAELAFLRSPNALLPAKLIRQALRVRPNDAQVLFAAGREAALAGELKLTLDLWRRAYHQDVALRRSIMHQLGPQLPATAFIESFEPRLNELLELRTVYRAAGRPNEATTVALAYLSRLASSTSRQPEDADAWQQGYRLAAEIHDPRAIDFARQALRLDPLNETMRRRLGLEQLSQGELDEAIDNLQQYLRTNPSDREVHQKLESARVQRRVASSTR